MSKPGTSERRYKRTSALKFAGYELTEAYERHRIVLSKALLYNGPFEPEHQRDGSCQQQRQRRTMNEYKLGWHGGGDHGKLSFLASAMQLPHPAQHEIEDLPADLCEAVRFAVSQGPDIADWRGRALARIDAAAEELWELSERMLAESPAHVRHLVAATRKFKDADRSYNVALIACVIDATHHPDYGFVRRMLRGFPQIGTQVPVGVYCDGGSMPPKITGDVLNAHNNVTWNNYVCTSVRERALEAEKRDPAAAERMAKAVWDATIKECDAGVCEGMRNTDGTWRGLTLDELDKHPWVDGIEKARLLRRFGVEQVRHEATGNVTTVRGIDDGSENGLNDVYGGEDKLSLPAADSPARIGRQYHREWRRQGKGVEGFEYGMADVKKAFRRIPVMYCGLSCVVLWDPYRRTAAIFLLPGFNFGTISAVMAWNRTPALISHVARRLLAVPVIGYYDDFGVGGGSGERGSGLATLEGFGRHIFGFEPETRIPMTQGPIVAVGVLHDFRSTPNTGTIKVGVTQERKDSVCAFISEVERSGWATRADCSKLFGKARYVFCPVFGTVGLASLQPLSNPPSRLNLSDNSPGAQALKMLKRIVSGTCPVDFHVDATSQRPVVLLTDACTTEGKLGWLGVVLWDPDDGPHGRLYHAAGGVPPWMLALFERLQKKMTYIAAYELLAEVCAYNSFPDTLRGRIVHHFVDNTAALSGSIKGYSGKPDCARLVHALVVRILRLACRPWFGFVYSEDNLSDDPSREEFGLLKWLGSTRRVLVRLSLAMLGCDEPDIPGYKTGE